MDRPVALVTGASSGLGAHVAVHLASLGYALSLSGRNVTALRETADRCASAGGDALVVAGDLRLEEAAENAVDRTLERFGRMDLLVNGAVAGLADLPDLDAVARFDRIFDTNVRSVFHLTKLSLPHLAERRGSVVTLSAGCGEVPPAHLTPYCTGKAAADALTMSLALEQSEKGVRLNGLSLSSRASDVRQRGGLPPELMVMLLDPGSEPPGRRGTPDDVARAVAFLANATRAGFVTGHVLPLRTQKLLSRQLNAF